MSEQKKVIFERGEWDPGRFRVETQEPHSWRWSLYDVYLTKSAAISEAERLLRKSHISRVRVVDKGKN